MKKLKIVFCATYSVDFSVLGISEIQFGGLGTKLMCCREKTKNGSFVYKIYDTKQT